MAMFDSNGVAIAYESYGDGPPILLIHGFASNAAVNWLDTGWVDVLTGAGRRVITIDNRGHGRSQKLYDPADYGAPEMAEDARRLLDHLDIASCAVMGYSMGARIAAFLTLAHPHRITCAIFAGLAENMIRGVGGGDEVARALEVPDAGAVSAPGPRAFRLFAEVTGSDLRALAACMRSSRQKITAGQLATIRVPVLVAVGTRDDIAGRPEPLADVIPGAEILDIPGRDHMRAVGDQVYKRGVVAFLARCG